MCLMVFLNHSNKCALPILRASPLSLHLHPHLHFNIRNADADARKPPTLWRKYQAWMKFYAISLELPTYVRDLEEAFYHVGQAYWRCDLGKCASTISIEVNLLWLPSNFLRFKTMTWLFDKLITSYTMFIFC